MGRGIEAESPVPAYGGDAPKNKKMEISLR
jgi:hypothetical protein